MTEEDTNAPAPAKERQPLNMQTVARVIETQRQHLTHAQAIVDSAARLLTEYSDYEIGEPHLGMCCEIIADVLRRAITALEPLSVPPTSDRPAADLMTLAYAVEAPRQQVFRAQAVAQAVAMLLQGDSAERNAAAMRLTFEGVVEMLEQAISALEPLNLGLPIPN